MLRRLNIETALNKNVELTLSYQRRIDVSVSNWICLS